MGLGRVGQGGVCAGGGIPVFHKKVCASEPGV